MIMGAARMYRWLTLLLFGSAQSVALARPPCWRTPWCAVGLMELVGNERLSPGGADGLFVVGPVLAARPGAAGAAGGGAASRCICREAVSGCAAAQREGPYAPLPRNWRSPASRSTRSGSRPRATPAAWTWPR
ncbi:MAG: hypothetical protein MZW92_64180 [Comamonadaceae bacterium]|nr:hypothetical protein [Comamonadaceae bacterium]